MSRSKQWGFYCNLRGGHHPCTANYQGKSRGVIPRERKVTFSEGAGTKGRINKAARPSNNRGAKAGLNRGMS